MTRRVLHASNVAALCCAIISPSHTRLRRPSPSSCRIVRTGAGDEATKAEVAAEDENRGVESDGALELEEATGVGVKRPGCIAMADSGWPSELAGNTAAGARSTGALAT